MSGKLQEKLAESFPQSMKEHYIDIDLSANIMEGSPPPKNIPPSPCNVCASVMETYLSEAKAPQSASYIGTSFFRVQAFSYKKTCLRNMTL